MWIGVVTLFPEMFAALNYGITGRALKDHKVNLQLWNPRDFSHDPHRTVDDRPYGGGPGMVMMAPPLQAAIKAAKSAAPSRPVVIHLSPQGKRFTQATAEKWVGQKNVVLVAGRYEGIDERLIVLEIDEEWSIGEYILSGGELAAMTMIDTMVRLVPGAIGDKESVLQDSLSSGLLKHAQYTRPDTVAGLEVPEVLIQGNHQAIARWRLKQSLGKTWLKRPDLLIAKSLNETEIELLMEFVQELTLKTH